PQFDRRIGTHDPLLVAGMEMDRNAAERTAPLHHGGVEVRMRYADCLQAAETLDQRDRCRVEHGDAVPQDVAGGGANEECALADRKCGLRPDADDPGLILTVGIEMSEGQPRERRPALAARRNVLPLFLADRAMRWRRTAWRILHPAGGANECVHLPAP